MPAYDYSRVADLYDDFCVFDGDLDFFRRAVTPETGPVLELMAGTGRVSLPLLAQGVNLTCVEHSPAMLAVLASKASRLGLAVGLVCADARALPLTAGFAMVILPFQGFTELVDEESQDRTMAEVARVLVPGGRFLCTSHNPPVRSRSIDGRWRELGRFPDRSGQTLVLHLKTSLVAPSGPVEGRQRIELLDRAGRLVERRELDLRFSLPTADTILDMARAHGLCLVELLGDYHGAPYDEQTSPCQIAVLERRGGNG